MSTKPVQSDGAGDSSAPGVDLNLDHLVLMRTPRAAWILVETEVVIHTADVSMTYVLNPTASLVWQCLDGDSTAGEILRDVADVFHVDEHRVFDEFGPVLHEWKEAGLVAQGAS